MDDSEAGPSSISGLGPQQAKRGKPSSKSRRSKGKGAATSLHSNEALAKQADSIAQKTRIPVSLQQSTPLLGARPPKSIAKIQDKKLRAHLSSVALQQKRAKEHAAVVDEVLNAPAPGEDAGLIETEHELERTARLTQVQIRDAVAVDAAKRSFSLDLSGGRGGSGLGPYRADYTRNGRHLLLGGRKGHLAAFDWQAGKLLCEIQVRETVRDVKWLHNYSFFAAAQKKFTFIYDSTGAEVHRLKDHIEVQRMEFLPYHFLLATVGNPGYLKYHDTSTGQIVAQHRTRLGSCSTMAQNPLTAVIHLGHANGTVTLWTPNLSTPALKLLAHRGPLSGVSISTRDGGREMATSSLDGSIKVWDSRMLGRGCVREWVSRKPASDLRYSQRGLLGAAWGSHVSIYDTKKPLGNAPPGPYLTNAFPSSPPISLAWCPFEDVLGVGHANGFDSLLVPGAGEPRFDSSEADPFESKTMRREREVRALLDKIQPDLITLDPEMLGSLDTRASRNVTEAREGSPERDARSGIAKSLDGRAYSRLTRLERLRLDGKADEGADAAVVLLDDENGVADEYDSEDEAQARTSSGAAAKVGAGKEREKEKRKMRGKNSAMKRFLRKKRQDVVDANTLNIRAKLDKSKREREEARERAERRAKGLPEVEEKSQGALGLFSRKTRRR